MPDLLDNFGLFRIIRAYCQTTTTAHAPESIHLKFNGSQCKKRKFVTIEGLDDYDEDKDFKEADETLHCDLVLYVKGHEASEILQSSEDRFTDARPKLMRDFGAETSVRRMEIVQRLVTLNMDDCQHEVRRYKSVCMELSRQVKEAQLSIDD